MDDLDALLADLQTNLSKVSPHPASTLQHSVHPRHQNSTTHHVVVSLDQPESYHDPKPVPHHSPHQYTYQNSAAPKSPQADQMQNGHHLNSSQASSYHTYQNLPASDQMYRHEMREEVRTETRSSGPNPSPLPASQNNAATSSTQRSATMSNNLSELDSLLHDLNTSKHNSTYKETSVVNGNRPSVDSLLDELNSVGHRESLERRTVTHETRVPQPTPPSVPSYSQKVTHVSASNATKELDDLMESLSDFKDDSSSSRTTTTTDHVRGTSQTRAAPNQSRRVILSSDLVDDAPPRPPPPTEKDALPVPPPRPPAPATASYVPLPLPPPPPPEVSVPAVLPAPIVPSPTPATVSIIYTQPDQPQHRPPESLVEDAFVRPESGGPVKRNDAEYRWVTDQIKHEVREIVERPSPPPEEVEDKVKINRINASSLQSQVDTAYAKPLPKPKPKPQPVPEPPVPPPNQLDSMLGSLTSHMTEQGINTSQKGCCCACDKPIVGQVITALGKTWHPEHFVCAHCKEELGTKNFFERDGKPYCEPDYHNLFSPKCAYCSGPILDKCVTAMNTTWHPEHFFCAQCGNTFGEEGFHEKNGKPYCKEDYFNMFAPKCGGCNSPIMENYISALNCQWHPECFVCRDCKQSVASKSFYEMDGSPVCGECLGIEDDGEEEEED